MNEPVTKLDPRYSVPDGVATSWEQTRRVLETAELFWLSTVRTDGRPHVTPLVAVWHDDALHFNTADTSQKAVNLRGNPHVHNGSFQLGGDTILVFSVTPTKVFAFAKGHISHTRHQF